jgi:high-affinity iron transporter
MFDACLIVGIVPAVTGSVARRFRWIGGVLAGVVTASLVAAFAGALSQLFEDMGQELFNGGV